MTPCLNSPNGLRVVVKHVILNPLGNRGEVLGRLLSQENFRLGESEFGEPGVGIVYLARAISGILGHYGISLKSVHQKGRKSDGAVPIVMMSHLAREADVRKALSEIAELDVVADRPVLIIGTHFAAPTAGKIVSDGEKFRLDY